MTGESDECVKDIPDNCLQKLQELIDDEKPGDEKDRTHHSIPSPLLMSGTQIQTGEGWFLIIVVGKNSAMGIINAKIQQKGAEMTPLQEKLEAIATDIGKLGMISAYITIMVLFVRFWIDHSMESYNWSDNAGIYVLEWFRYLIIGVTIVIVAVP